MASVTAASPAAGSGGLDRDLVRELARAAGGETAPVRQLASASTHNPAMIVELKYCGLRRAGSVAGAVGGT
jgi:hypothetical protein